MMNTERSAAGRAAGLLCLFVVTVAALLAMADLAPAQAACADGCYYPYGDGNCPTFGCCGGPEERFCCTGCIGSDADDECAPGLVLEADLKCHYPCAVRKGCSFPYGDGNCPTLGCCGGDGERFCVVGPGSDAPSACKPGLVQEIDGKCHQPCAIRNNCAYPYGDGNCPTLGCCGGEGERQCCVGCIGSEAPAACMDGLVAAITCQRPRVMGEACGPDAPCKDGLQCGITSLKCEVEAGDSLFTREECLALYSQDLSDAAKDANTTMSYGIQAVLSAGASGSYEVGTVYGQEGQYGCYLTYCIGGETNLAVAAGFCLGLADDWESFTGESFVITEAAGEIIGFTTSQSFDDEDCAFSDPSCLSGTSDCVNIVLDLLPVSVGAYHCETLIRTVYGDDPPEAKCKDVETCANAACAPTAADIDNGSYDPNDETITKSQVPAGPYAVGIRDVTLSVTDTSGNVDACTGEVSIRDCTPPSIQCPAAQTAECQSDLQAVLTVPTATATDTCGGATVEPQTARSFPLGTTSFEQMALDQHDNTATCRSNVTVQDTLAPSVTITAPSANLCSGQPVTIASIVSDVCDPSPRTTYSPAGGPTYSVHGDYTVSVTATDLSSNTAHADATFTVDRVAPTVAIVNKSQLTMPGAKAPVALVVTSSDEDGAAGSVTWERVLLNDCVLFDGRSYGNGDGLLRDEEIAIGPAEACRAATLCGYTVMANPKLTFEAYDCGGNRSTDSKTFTGTFPLGKACSPAAPPRGSSKPRTTPVRPARPATAG